MMPVWGGWLMFAFGIIVGWIIGHQLGVQWEARRFLRDTELVLHNRLPEQIPEPAEQPLVPSLKDLIVDGEHMAADFFAASMLFYSTHTIEALAKGMTRMELEYTDAEIDGQFRWAFNLCEQALVIDRVLYEMFPDHIYSQAEWAEDELDQAARLITHRMRVTPHLV